MAERGWLSITGAGDGIMRAGHEGPGRDSSFGLAIRLPFETTANDIILGDEKLIHFRYFFTRKLMFVSQSAAVAVFPGGFGTQDEIFEALTLIQTGKSSMVPVVLVEGEGGKYWKHWENYIDRSLREGGFISEEDPGLYYIAKDPEDAARHVIDFYHNYHSSRYVGDDFVMRLKKPLTDDAIKAINKEFEILVREGEIRMTDPYEEEDEHTGAPPPRLHAHASPRGPAPSAHRHRQRREQHRLVSAIARTCARAAGVFAIGALSACATGGLGNGATAIDATGAIPIAGENANGVEVRWWFADDSPRRRRPRPRAARG